MAAVNVDKVAVSSRNYGRIALTLENCLFSDEKISCTPSELDGLDRSLETDLRLLGAELIQTAGILLRLPQTAMATGQVLLHRFYYSKSLIKYPMEVTAMAAVCLASKIEEAPRRNRDVINVFNHIKQVRNKKTITPVVLDGHYVNLKNQVIKAERRILKELGFCVHVQHPHKMIVMYLRFLRKENNRELLQYACGHVWPAGRSTAERVVKSVSCVCELCYHDVSTVVVSNSDGRCKACLQLCLAVPVCVDPMCRLSSQTARRAPYARNAMNDLLRTDVFTRYSPETVAAACIYLAARVRRVPLPNRPHWFHVFNMQEQQLQDIAEQTLKLYRRDKPDGVALERAVEQLRCRQQEHRLLRTAGRHGGLPSSGGNTPLGAGLGAGSNFSPAVVAPGSRHNSPPTAGSNPAGAAADDGAGKGSSTSPPNGSVAGPPPQISNNSSGAVNGDSRTDKENIAISHHHHHRDSSRSHSSVEESNRSGHKSKHNNSRDRSRYRSRSPKRHRRSVSPRDDRNTSGSNRRSSKHKRNKDKRSKYGSQSSDRARSPIVRSKPRRDRSRSVSQDRHKSSKRRNQQSESHKRR